MNIYEMKQHWEQKQNEARDSYHYYRGAVEVLQYIITELENAKDGREVGESNPAADSSGETPVSEEM